MGVAIHAAHAQNLPLSNPHGYRSPGGPCIITSQDNTHNMITVLPKNMDLAKDAVKSPIVVMTGPNGSLTIMTDTRQTNYVDMTREDPKNGGPLTTWGKATDQQMSMAVDSIKYCGSLPPSGQPYPQPTPELLHEEMEKAKQYLQNHPDQSN